MGKTLSIFFKKLIDTVLVLSVVLLCMGADSIVDYIFQILGI